jgi:hypothetical protein
VRWPGARGAALASTVVLVAPALAAQGHGDGHPEGHGVAPAEQRPWRLGAQAIGVVTRAAPAYDGRTYVEGYLTQPVLMGHVGLFGDRLQGTATVNFEGATLRRGELNAGIYGEGYIDRRHPHTFVHELMASAQGAAGPVRLSLAGGKGFVPFGTDDPMTRPFVKYPVNHHLAQILERYVAAAAARYRVVLVEVAAFNGDEPFGPSSWPSASRFGDSWASRLTLAPGSGLEAAASVARVSSPEQQVGDGLDQRKSSLAGRWERRDSLGRRAYALVEWARTDEMQDGRRAFRYQSVLAEATTRVRRLELGARYERTGRPEEERLLDPFRSPRPHPDYNVLGITEWTIVTAAAAARVDVAAGIALRPFVEVARLGARELVRPSTFVPADFYGSSRQWSLSVGVRMDAGVLHPRMGHYGVAGDAHVSHPR